MFDKNFKNNYPSSFKNTFSYKSLKHLITLHRVWLKICETFLDIC